MNIFVLDTEPRVAARYHHDIHVKVMVKEAAQMLSVAHRMLNDHPRDVYEITHVNHPCSKWVRESEANYLWLYDLFRYLAEEYKLRFHKQHKSYMLLNRYLQHSPSNIEDRGLTGFVQAMPLPYRGVNAIQAYRGFYVAEKLSFGHWSPPSSKPWWVHELLKQQELQHDS